MKTFIFIIVVGFFSAHAEAENLIFALDAGGRSCPSDQHACYNDLRWVCCVDPPQNENSCATDNSPERSSCENSGGNWIERSVHDPDGRTEAVCVCA